MVLINPNSSVNQNRSNFQANFMTIEHLKPIRWKIHSPSPMSQPAVREPAASTALLFFDSGQAHPSGLVSF
jgi:hypothetical protein